MKYLMNFFGLTLTMILMTSPVLADEAKTTPKAPIISSKTSEFYNGDGRYQSFGTRMNYSGVKTNFIKPVIKEEGVVMPVEKTEEAAPEKVWASGSGWQLEKRVILRQRLNE